MTPLDPEVAAAVRAALGLREGDAGPGDLAAAAQAVNAAGDAARLDAGSLLLLAARLVASVQAEPGDWHTLGACRRALAAGGWPLETTADLGDLTAALLALCAAHMTAEEVAAAIETAGGLP